MTPVRTRAFGPSATQVAMVGQGSWRTNESQWTAAVDALRHGLDLGLTHIDTAEMYGAGEAEKIIAEAIEGRRDEVFLVSKVLPNHASKQATVTACEQSLARLRTDRLDCYLLHWRGAHPLQETLEGFELLIRQGKIRSWGVSNFDVEDLADIAALAGPGHPTCNQVLYHLQERAIEHAVLPWCQEHGTAVVAYTPFGEKPGIYDPKSEAGKILAAIGALHRATPRQVALAFLLRHPNSFVIPKAARAAHVEENAGAGTLTLTADDIARIDAAFPRGKKPRNLPMI